MEQLLLGISPDWIPNFENFVAGRNVELLSSLNLALNKKHSNVAFYIWGESGSGKSHLLHGAVEKALAQNFTAVYSRGMVPDATQMVAVDDVELLDDAAQISLFKLYNHQLETGGLLLLSGSVAPALLSLREDLRTRMGWGLVYQVQALSDEEKAIALQQHARARGLILAPEVTHYLLHHGRRDLPALLSVLDMLDEQCLRLKRGATVPLLKEVMQLKVEKA